MMAAPAKKRSPVKPGRTDEVQWRTEMLEAFLEGLRAYQQTQGSQREVLKSQINRLLQRVRGIVIEAGCMQLVTLEPPRMVGGAIHHDVDPIASMFHSVYDYSFIPTVINIIEQTIGVVQAPGYMAKLTASTHYTEEDRARCLQRVEQLCRRFPLVARQLQSRHDQRGTLEIEDEYDVQDLFHGLLRIDFDDVRDEEWTPSYAGKCARVDFLLKPEKIVVEAKKTRKGLGARQVGDHLLIDIARYRAHPDCLSLVCFVYDPEHRIDNPRGLENDLSRSEDDLDVRVIIVPSDG